ncbi:MAG: ATP synthase F1 subunit epsilon [Erysipelotrichaceae bacterium]|nr:ATP synthase F1 subunit epsilon [Erysipelotrichaceae bacterium]
MKLHLRIIDLDGEYFSQDVDFVIVNTSDGEITVLANHIPLISNIKISRLTISNDEEVTEYAIAGGTLFISETECKIITTAIEKTDEIDENRAQDAKRRAEERIKTQDDSIDMARAQAALARAINRISLLNRTK